VPAGFQEINLISSMNDDACEFGQCHCHYSLQWHQQPALEQQYCMAVKYHHNNNINESISRSIDQSADADQSRRAGQQGTIV